MNDLIKKYEFEFKQLYTGIAIKSKHPKHKHAALLFKDGELIASGNNSKEQHAETKVIEVAKLLGYKTGENLILISIALSKDGKFKLAKPCMACMVALKLYNIALRNIYYSTKKQRIVRL